jgi:ferredoxin
MFVSLLFLKIVYHIPGVNNLALRDDYCDGLGSCLPVCPTGAITFENANALISADCAVTICRGC